MQDFLDRFLAKVTVVSDGDRFEIGGRRFLLAIEEREREPDAYELKS